MSLGIYLRLLRADKIFMKASRAAFGKAANILVFAAIMGVGFYLLSKSMQNDTSSSEPSIGKILEQNGNVQMRRSRYTDWKKANNETPVFDRTTLFTDKNSKVAFSVRGTKVQLDEKTLVQIEDPKRQTALTMDFGVLRLNSSKRENVILNVGGERIQVGLNDSDVTIQRDRAGHTRIESHRGKTIVKLKGREQVVDEATPLSMLTSSVPAPIETPPEVVHPPTASINMNYESQYTEDERFVRRPQLHLQASGSDVSNIRYEVLEGQSWKPLQSDKFVPNEPGEYSLRAVGTSSSGEAVYSPPDPWKVGPEHFALHQPQLETKEFTIDPLKKPKVVSLFDKAEVTAVEIRAKDQTELQTIAHEPSVSLGDLPLDTEWMRVRAANGETHGFENSWQKIDISTPAPKVSFKSGQFQMAKILNPQFTYEGRVVESSDVLDLASRHPAIPTACQSGCTVSFRYKNDHSPNWRSEETIVSVPGLVAPPTIRRMASEDTTPFDKTLTLKSPENSGLRSDVAPWDIEFGLGGNYLVLQTDSPTTNSKISGLSGPTIFLQGEKRFGTWGVKLAVLDVNSKVNVSNNGTQQSHNVQWQSFFAGATGPGWWIFRRLEYGLSYEGIPLLYEGVAGSEISNGQMLAATLGFNSKFSLGGRDYLAWDQRLLIPFYGSAGSGASSLNPEFGLDGTLSYYHCLKHQWGIGISWFGQYTMARFSVPAGASLLAETDSINMLNSNLQFRVTYGVCAQ